MFINTLSVAKLKHNPQDQPHRQKKLKDPQRMMNTKDVYDITDYNLIIKIL